MTSVDAAAQTVEVRGIEVPKLGFGTFRLPRADCREGVRDWWSRPEVFRVM